MQNRPDPRRPTEASGFTQPSYFLFSFTISGSGRGRPAPAQQHPRPGRRQQYQSAIPGRLRARRLRRGRRKDRRRQPGAFSSSPTQRGSAHCERHLLSIPSS